MKDSISSARLLGRCTAEALHSFLSRLDCPQRSLVKVMKAVTTSGGDSGAMEERVGVMFQCAV